MGRAEKSDLGEGRRAGLVAAALLMAAALPILFWHLGTPSLYGDEAIYAIAARTVAGTGTHLGPGGNALPLATPGLKPPLKILAQAWLYRLMGQNEFSTRALDAVFGLILVFLVFALTRPWLGSGGGLFAALLLLAARGLVFDHGLRSGNQESALVLTFAAALGLYGQDVVRGRRERPWLYGLLLGLGMLSKAPIPLVAVGVMALHGALRAAPGARLAVATHRTPVVAGALAVALFLPWLAYAVSVRGFGFLLSYGQGVGRLVTPLDKAHGNPPSLYAEVLWTNFGWWLLLLWPAAAATFRARREGKPNSFDWLLLLWLWVAVTLLAFGLSASRLQWYVYPLFPALACLLAAGAEALVRVQPYRSGRLALAALFALAMAGDLRPALLRAQQDTKVIDIHRLARLVAQRPGARVWIDPSLRDIGRWIREWDFYYATSVSHRFAPAADLDDTSGCVLLLAPPHPPGDPAWEGRPARVLASAQRPLVVGDACGGLLAADW